ncbi:hypothetical protein [Microbacterium sp. 10M-3C3]|uniref:hypothetical protein n=1 Tax=Microbacterium sp. 10M-3C3 TaxID=2483401 RepID=UPI001F0B83DF|nr:hypothetical protein [Microbacterium sp. 10M-3C3]
MGGRVVALGALGEAVEVGRDRLELEPRLAVGQIVADDAQARGLEGLRGSRAEVGAAGEDHPGAGRPVARGLSQHVRDVRDRVGGGEVVDRAPRGPERGRPAPRALRGEPQQTRTHAPACVDRIRQGLRRRRASGPLGERVVQCGQLPPVVRERCRPGEVQDVDELHGGQCVAACPQLPQRVEDAQRQVAVGAARDAGEGHRRSQRGREDAGGGGVQAFPEHVDRERGVLGGPAGEATRHGAGGVDHLDRDVAADDADDRGRGHTTPDSRSDSTRDDS